MYSKFPKFQAKNASSQSEYWLTLRTATSAIDWSSGLSGCLELSEERSEAAMLLVQVTMACLVKEHWEPIRNPKFHICWITITLCLFTGILALWLGFCGLRDVLLYFLYLRQINKCFTNLIPEKQHVNHLHLHTFYSGEYFTLKQTEP